MAIDNDAYPDCLDELCRHCELTFGAHRGSDNACPNHEGWMDYETMTSKGWWERCEECGGSGWVEPEE